VRASVGTTFQAPQLTELYVPPVLPLPNSDGYISVGNPNLRADRATGFDFGFEQRLGRSGSTHAGIDLYRTNLRTPAQRYLPSATCTAGSDDAAACLTYPVNVGGAVYRGIELQLDRALGRTTVVRAAYGINSSYATSVSPEFQNGTIVRGEQSPGVPLHKALLSLEKRASSGLSYEAGLVYEDGNNELNRPAFATVHAGVSFAVHAVEANLLVSNLTNVYADRFTHLGAGDPYGGQLGPIPTDAYALPGRAVNFAITHRFRRALQQAGRREERERPRARLGVIDDAVRIIPTQRKAGGFRLERRERPRSVRRGASNVRERGQHTAYERTVGVEALAL